MIHSEFSSRECIYLAHPSQASAATANTGNSSRKEDSPSAYPPESTSTARPDISVSAPVLASSRRDAGESAWGNTHMRLLQRLTNEQNGVGLGVSKGSPLVMPFSHSPGSTSIRPASLSPPRMSRKRLIISDTIPPTTTAYPSLSLEEATFRDTRWAETVVERTCADPELMEEIIQAFFHRIHLYQIMFHPPSFHHRRYCNLIPGPLIFAMCAMSVRYVNHPILHPGDHPNASRATSGEPFAEAARRGIESWLRARNTLADRTSIQPGSWEELEMCQAMFLLCPYNFAMFGSVEYTEMTSRYLGER